MSKRTFEGTVVSDKMQKTVVVAVDIPKRHPLYNKTVRNTKRFKARDEMGVHVGDVVTIEESKPYSKETTWKVISVKKESE